MNYLSRRLQNRKQRRAFHKAMNDRSAQQFNGLETLRPASLAERIRPCSKMQHRRSSRTGPPASALVR